MVPFITSMLILSPSSTIAIGPLSAASGEIWPTKHPLFVPEKRPSVTTAVDVCSSMPYRYFNALYISTIPGPPLRPSYLMTTTSASRIMDYFKLLLGLSMEVLSVRIPLEKVSQLLKIIDHLIETECEISPRDCLRNFRKN